MSEKEVDRRLLLTTLGTGCLGALAGCSGRSGDDESTRADTETADGTTEDSTTTGEDASESEPTETAAGGHSIETETTFERAESSQTLVVSTTVEASAGIDRVNVTVGDESRSVSGGGETGRSFELTFPVEGGRAYTVDVELVDANGDRDGQTVETTHIPIHVDPVETDRLVGVNYYPWFGEKAPSHSPHRDDWVEESTLTPVLGEYDSADPEVIDQHLQWCLEHGIEWLSISWWGPDDHRDEIIQQDLRAREAFADIQYSITYETQGRLADNYHTDGIDLDDDSVRGQLAADLEYFDENHFGEQNYLHIDGRPVLYLYSAQLLEGDVEAAFEEIAATTGVEPYILADLPTARVVDFPISRVADGVTNYNPYHPREDIEEVFHDLYKSRIVSMYLGASALDADFVPSIIPGFDDTAVTHVDRDNPPLEPSPERFERCCDQLDPHMGDAEAVLITSFNEWYESTAIEPAEEFGTDYLELTSEKLATGESSGYDQNGTIVELDWGQLVVPAERDSGSGDTRELAFMCNELTVLDGAGDPLVSYDIGSEEDEPVYIGGSFFAESYDGETMRWFGTSYGKTTMLVDADRDAIGGLELRGSPITEMEVRLAVGDRSAVTRLEDGAHTYRLML